MTTPNVFLSWSGDRSRAVAETLRDWLPKVIQAVKPWLSAGDIESGARWAQAIGKQLQESSVGILCMTADNLQAPWIMFEAGALSKALDESRVIPYLLDVEPADLQGPLVQFQAMRATDENTLELLTTLNKTLETGLSEARLKESFEMWWGSLDDQLKTIRKQSGAQIVKKQRDQREILEELLELARAQERRAAAEDTSRAFAAALETVGNWAENYRGVQPGFGPPASVSSLLAGRSARVDLPGKTLPNIARLVGAPIPPPEREAKPQSQPRKLKRRHPPPKPPGPDKS